MESFSQCLEAVKEYCREYMPDAAYNLWIKGIEEVSYSVDSAVVSVSSDFIRQTVESRYLSLLHQGFEAVMGYDLELSIVTRDSEPQPAEPVQDIRPVSQTSSYTFDNFVIGPDNRFAHAAAVAVAANPSNAYNPLFIYGPSGLGKTHLLMAIKNQLAETRPELNVLYIGGDAFTNELIAAIGTGSTEPFHEKYRNVDVLLVDDVQFIGGKESTQEEFFHTFNALHEAHKQIVLTSDRPKANDMNMTLAPEVAEYIAKHLKNDVRQLEGAVKKLYAYSLINGADPNLDAAHDAIQDIVNEQMPWPATVDKIIGEVARTFNVTAEDIRSSRQTAQISQARQVSMYIIREVTGNTLDKIGNEFNRNHATVVYAIDKIIRQTEEDRNLKSIIEDIIKNCQQ